MPKILTSDSQSKKHMEFKTIYAFFDELPAEIEPRNKPEGSVTYKFKWSDIKEQDFWKVDGYRWKQIGTKNLRLDNKTLKKKYFRLATGPNISTPTFKRLVYFRPDRPQEVVIQYVGKIANVPILEAKPRKKATILPIRSKFAPILPKKTPEADSTLAVVKEEIISEEEQQEAAQASEEGVSNPASEEAIVTPASGDPTSAPASKDNAPVSDETTPASTTCQKSKIVGSTGSKKTSEKKKVPMTVENAIGWTEGQGSPSFRKLEFNRTYPLFDELPAETEPRFRPEAGTSYKFVWAEDKRQDDWKADGYRWHHIGSKILKNLGCAMKKKYYHAINGPNSRTTMFQKWAFSRPDKPNMMVVKYIGDSSTARHFPHGNSKRGEPYVRTQPHVIKDIKAAVGTDSTIKIYKKMVGGNSGEDGADASQTTPKTGVPRNYVQVSNTLANFCRLKLPHDSLYDLIEFSSDTEFVHHVTMYPDVVVILYHKQLMEMFRGIFANANLPTQVLMYSSSFQLGDYSLSVLLCHETEFVSKPVFPLMYMIHDKNTYKTHSIFFSHVSEVVPELLMSKNVVIITSQDSTILTAVVKSLPSLPLFRCWNEIIKSSRRWLEEHGILNELEIKFYLQSLYDLVKCETEEDYQRLFNSCLSKWSHTFSEYFTDKIHNLSHQICLWRAQQYKLKDVTIGQCESLSCVLKQLAEWKEAPLDSVALVLYRLSQFFISEIQKGKSSSDANQLIPGVACSEPSSSSSPDITPETIVSNIQSKLANEKHTRNISERDAIDLPASVLERAYQAVQNNNVVLNSIGIFVVKGTNEPRIVTLFPKQTCSCPASTKCYHIVAAQLAIGLQCFPPEKRPGSLTRLIRNRNRSRARANKANMAFPSSYRKAEEESGADPKPAVKKRRVVRRLENAVGDSLILESAGSEQLKLELIAAHEEQQLAAKVVENLHHSILTSADEHTDVYVISSDQTDDIHIVDYVELNIHTDHDEVSIKHLNQAAQALDHAYLANS